MKSVLLSNDEMLVLCSRAALSFSHRAIRWWGEIVQQSTTTERQRRRHIHDYTMTMGEPSCFPRMGGKKAPEHALFDPMKFTNRAIVDFKVRCSLAPSVDWSLNDNEDGEKVTFARKVLFKSFSFSSENLFFGNNSVSQLWLIQTRFSSRKL